jgi:hypothetical protein
MSDQYPQESPVGSRNEAFADGIVGTGQSDLATSMQQNVDPNYSPQGVLAMYENLPSGIGQDPRVTGAKRTMATGITGAMSPGSAPGANPGSTAINA